MLVQKLLNRGLHLLRAELLATVAGSGDLLKRDLDLRLLQGLAEQLTLMARHEGVLLAMRDEERRRILCDVRDGIGTLDLLGVFLDGTAYQLGLRRGGGIVFQ